MRVFVTGATGWIGSALVPELRRAGHEVVGLARSDGSAATLTAAGAGVVRGTLDDDDRLAEAAAASDGVVHLAFKHEEAFTGDFPAATAADRRAIRALAGPLEGTGKPLVVTTGLAGHPSGALVTEEDRPDTGSVTSERMLAEQLVGELAGRGVRASSVRLAPTVHGEGDSGFVAALVAVARERRVSGHLGDGSNTWPAVHRLDAARLFRLALERAPAGSVLHGAAEEGVPLRAVAEAIGRRLDVPVRPVADEDAGGHFGWLAPFAALDVRASSALTRERVGWQPTHQGLLADIEEGHYTRGT